MPFKANKRQKRRAYYKKHADDEKAFAKGYYVVNKGAIIDRVLERSQALVTINPTKSKAYGKHCVANHRFMNSEVAKANTRQHVANYRSLNAEVAKANTRQHVANYRSLNAEVAKANTRQHVANYRSLNAEVAKQHVANYRSLNTEVAKANTRQHVANYRSRNTEVAKANTRQHVANYWSRNTKVAKANTRQHVANYRSLNTEVAKANTRQYVATYREHNTDKARASSCMSMRKCCQSKEPAKSIVQNRQWVSVHYHKNLERSRALSRTSTAKHYMQQLKANRSKSRHTSKVWYKKISKVIKMRRRNPLAEPSPQVVNHLMTDLQDTFCKSKSIVKKILKGVRELPAWKVKGGKSQKHSACKYASSHLVRVCLQNRRQAAAIILRIKHEVMDTTLDGIKDLVIVVTLCPGNPGFMMQATHMITCPSLHTPTACLL